MENLTLEQILEGAVIVMLDDNVELNKSYSRRFTRAGNCQFHTFVDLFEALKFIKENEVDLLILDMRIPGTHGVKVLEEISTYNKFVPVIINSAYLGEEDVKEEELKKIYPIVAQFDKYQTFEDMTLAVKNGVYMSKLNRKALEEATAREIESKSKAEMVQQLSRGFAHEINNANAVISSSLSALEEEFEYFKQLEIEHLKTILGPEEFKIYLKVSDSIVKNEETHIDFDKKLELMNKYNSGLVAHAIHFNVADDIDSFKKLYESEYQEKILSSLDHIKMLFSRLGAMKISSSRINETVKAAKDITAMDIGEKVNIDVNQCLDNVIRMLYISDKRDTELLKNYENVPTITGNLRQISESLLNIIKNSFEAVQNKGIINIRTSLKDDYVCVEIMDNGPGIPSENIEKIFNPFYTTKIGTNFGIGLYISKRYIELNGGKLEVYSKQGETLFKILLPVKKNEQETNSNSR